MEAQAEFYSDSVSGRRANFDSNSHTTLNLSLVGHNNAASVYTEAVRRAMTTPVGRLAPALLRFGLVLN